MALGLYFWARSPCREYEAGPLALRWPDPTGLAEPVIALVWGEGIAGQVGNALLLLGLAAAGWPAGPRPSDGDDGARAPAFAPSTWLARGVVAQLALTLLLALQVVKARYYFLDRVFLHLVVCRALLAAVGGWWLWRRLEARAGPSRRLALRTLAAGLAVFALALAFLGLRARAEGGPVALTAAETAPCSELGGTLVVDRLADTRWALGPNFVVRLARDRARCGADRGDGPRHVLAADGAYRISRDAAPGAVPLEQCGRQVVLGP